MNLLAAVYVNFANVPSYVQYVNKGIFHVKPLEKLLLMFVRSLTFSSVLPSFLLKLIYLLFLFCSLFPSLTNSS